MEGNHVSKKPQPSIPIFFALVMVIDTKKETAVVRIVQWEFVPSETLVSELNYHVKWGRKIYIYGTVPLAHYGFLRQKQ